jgi:cytochrome c oxidase cbb3-type subunit 3
MSKDNKKQDVGTTGHEWDGIEELNNPLPRWWVWIFYATIVWGIWYTIAYPAWPMLKEATSGYLGYSTRQNVADEIAAVEAQNAEILAKLETTELAAIADDAELHQFAVNGGAAIFLANCSQCHGSGAAGAKGYPNLLDDDWIWGGTIEEIAYTVEHGIRNEQSPDARWTEMPAFGEILPKEEISAVVQHLLAISGQEHDATQLALGEEVYLNNCAGCHGDAGEGIREMGAPQLNDAIWLYGGDEATLTETVMNARFGVMPAWGAEWQPAAGLTGAEVKAVSSYVHQLGGGE